MAENCIGELSSLIVNGLICFCIFWVIVKLGIIASSVALLLFSTTGASIWSWKITYVILISLAQLPYLSSTSMLELKCTTYLFFTTIISLLSILSTKIYFNGAQSLTPDQSKQ